MGLRTVHSLSRFIDIHYSETFGPKIYYKILFEHMARYKGHITPPEHYLASLLK